MITEKEVCVLEIFTPQGLQLPESIFLMLYENRSSADGKK